MRRRHCWRLPSTRGAAVAAGDGVGRSWLAAATAPRSMRQAVGGGRAAGFVRRCRGRRGALRQPRASVAAGWSGGTAAIWVARSRCCWLPGRTARTRAPSRRGRRPVVGDRIRGQEARRAGIPASDGSGAGEATPLTTSVMFEVAAGCDDLAAAPARRSRRWRRPALRPSRTSRLSCRSASLTTSVDCAVWIWVWV